MTRTLILGGARSGKSRRALALASQPGKPVTFVATAEALDSEMAERIALHKQERPAGWETLEVPLDLADALQGATGSETVWLVDCLTLWLSNLMHAGRDPAEETERLCAVIADVPAPLVVVSNETGLGLVPETALGRMFRDAQGRLNQAVAATCDRVEFVAAGLPMVLKDASSD